MVASGAATKGVTVMKQTPPAAVGRRHLLEISASAAGVIALSACSGSPPEPGKGRPDTTPEQEVPVTAPEDLMREHGVLKRILLIYREGIRRLQADDQSPAPALNESAQIIRRFIEDYHGQLEEQYVFPKLEQAGKLTDITSVLRTQHQRGRVLTDRVLAATTAAAAFDQPARDTLAQDMAALEASSSGRAAQITGEVLHGQIVPTLANISRQVAMVVLGYRGQGAVAGALLGSVSSSLVRHAHGPVAVIPEEPRPARPPHAPVVVGIDGSPTSGLAAEIAFDEASRRGVDLVALHAWSDMGPLDFPRLNWAPIEWRNLEDEQEKMLARRLSGWQDRYPDVVVHKVVVCDRPAPRLLELAQTAQLVVVGSHGRGGFPGMHLGSVSRAVVNSGQAPVIVARIPQDPAVPA